MSRKQKQEKPQQGKRVHQPDASGGGLSITGALAVIGTVVMLPMAVLFIAVWLAGWQLGVVRTGSMEPALPTGSMIVTSPITADEVETGMILEFVDPQNERRIITHRVIEVQRDAGGQVRFVTKGDANAERDTAEVPAENVRAKVRWHIRGLGSLMWKMRWPNSLVFVAAPLILVIASSALKRRKGDASAGAVRAAGGTRVASPPGSEPVACGSCAVVIDSVDRYCRNCGTRRYQRPSRPRRRTADASPEGDRVLVDA